MSYDTDRRGSRQPLLCCSCWHLAIRRGQNSRFSWYQYLVIGYPLIVWPRPGFPLTQGLTPCPLPHDENRTSPKSNVFRECPVPCPEFCFSQKDRVSYPRRFFLAVLKSQPHPRKFSTPTWLREPEALSIAPNDCVFILTYDFFSFVASQKVCESCPRCVLFLFCFFFRYIVVCTFTMTKFVCLDQQGSQVDGES